MNEYVLAENHRVIESVRAWSPGDGLTCVYSKAAPRDIPCGPPVAVKKTVHLFERKIDRVVHRVLCANHLSGVIRPGEVRAEAAKAALERIATTHWDEYQRFIKEEVDKRIESLYGDMPEEIRRLVIDTATKDAA